MKERLDVILVKRGHTASREKAKALILSGNVYVDGCKVRKAGTFLDEEIQTLEVRGDAPAYVSRGGLKLEKALRQWEIDLRGKVCMDIGASTGGFTDCMLQNGAARVYAVDAGREQLAEKLKGDARVVCMEETNFRYMTPEDMGERPDFAGADVSFISLTKILIPARELLKSGGEMVCLIKPQFEAGREKVGKKGVVRDIKTHRQVIAKIVDYADLIGFAVLGLAYSPIRGPEGNIEYLLHLRREKETPERIRNLTEQEAEAALRTLTEEEKGLSHHGEWEELIAEVARESVMGTR